MSRFYFAFVFPLSLGLVAWPALAQTPTPGYNTQIPAAVTTPDTVETRIGTLNFFDGFPTKETSQKVYDNLDFLRGVEVFLNFVPAASIEAIRIGSGELGVKNFEPGSADGQVAGFQPALPHREY